MDLAAEALTVGFGISFYGFFAAAIAWLIVYFYWAFRADRRERRTPPR